MITDDVLSRFSPFNLLTVHHLLDALDALEYVRLEAGGFLFKRGKSLSEVYFLLEGSINLIDHNFDSRSLSAGTLETAGAINSDEAVTSVTARATTDVLAFAMNREHLQRLVEWSQAPDSGANAGAQGLSTEEGFADDVDPEDDDWFDRLLSSHLFSRIPMAHVQQLFTKLRSIPVKAGEKVMREGERGDYFYVLAKGSALITNALDTVRLELSPGAAFGEEALLGSTIRNASVTMLTDGIIKRLNEEDFNTLIRRPVMRYIENAEVEALTQPFSCVDVKMPIEYRAGHYPGAVNIPLARLRESLSELAEHRLYLIPDDAEGRADIAAHLMCQAGFDARIIKNAAEVIFSAQNCI